MSEYVDFYIRSHGDEFIPLQSFCRVTPIYGTLTSFFFTLWKNKSYRPFFIKTNKTKIRKVKAKHIKNEIELQKETLNFIKNTNELLADKLAARNDA